MLQGVKTKPLIKGNHHKATEIDAEEVLGITRYNPPPFKRFFVPQRLLVSAPLDAYGRPQVEFSEFSKLIDRLPAGTVCYLDSLYINNFIGSLSNSSGYCPLTGTIISQTFTSTSTFTLTITSNPNGARLALYDLFTFKTAEGYAYQAYVSTASSTAPVFTILDPTTSYSGAQVPAFGSGVDFTAGFGKTAAAQTITGTYMRYDTATQGMSGVSCVNVELVDYTNSKVYDTKIDNYSRIVGTAQAPNVHNRQDQPTEINWRADPSVNNCGFPITDKDMLNNRNLGFRLTINDGSSLLPQPAPQYGCMPYNIAPNYTPASGGVLVPWGGSVGTGASKYTAPSSQYFVPTFNSPATIRFSLVFYPIHNTGDDYEG